MLGEGVGRRHWIAGLVAALWCLTLSPQAAQAEVVAGAGSAFPDVVHVGDTATPVSIEVRNDNTPPNLDNTICNLGAPFPCPIGDPGITLIPSCGQRGSFSSCGRGAADPGVFLIAPIGIGDASSACPGMVFDIVEIDPLFGRLRFTPQGGARVELPAPGSICKIAFDVDVLKMPAIDAAPSVPGLQTVQIVDTTQLSAGSVAASGRGASQGTTVFEPMPPGCEPSAPGTCEDFTPGRATMAAEAPATGCRRKQFRVYVAGTFIENVVFRVDGKQVKKLRNPNYRLDRYSLTIRPSTLKLGRHRITAQTRFAAVTGTNTRTISREFETCA